MDQEKTHCFLATLESVLKLSKETSTVSYPHPKPRTLAERHDWKGKTGDKFYLTNKEASLVICSVVKHAGSAYSTREV